MNTPQLPSVELIQGTAPHAQTQGPGRGRRWKIFFTVLILSAAIGAAYVYSRPAVYRASASVLTVKPKAVDQRSEAADVEHVAIQRRLLMGEDLLGRLSTTLEELGHSTIAGIEQLRSMLAVVAVPDTNLLELRAEGGDPEVLQRVANHWAESYEGFRAEEIEAATGRTTAEIADQQMELSQKIETARAELLAFREANQIVGLERGENRALASLKGLNDSLNKARETLVDAEARQASVADAIARGETVIPKEQREQITAMKLSVQRGRAHLAELRGRYTQAYMNRDPELKAFPAILRGLESELNQALEIAKVTVADEASQAVETARLSLQAIEAKLEAQQRDVQTFNERYKEFKALEEDLGRLEKLSADNAERLAQIEVKNLNKFPPIQIVEWARLPGRPIYPDYERDLMIALGIALGLALFITWLVEYLSGRSGAAQAAPQIGVRIYPGEQSPALAATPAQTSLPHQAAATAPTPHLQAPPADLPVLPRELGGAELQSLLAAADPGAGGQAALLLSGISPYELPLLHADCFDRISGTVSIPGAGARRIGIAPGGWRRIEPLLTGVDGVHINPSVAELSEQLRIAARKAHVTDPASIDAPALWHTYVLYLVRQGIDRSTLAERVGKLPTEMLDVLGHYAPPGGVRPASGIDFSYPALAY